MKPRGGRPRSVEQTVERRKMGSAAATRGWVELRWAVLGLVTLGGADAFGDGQEPVPPGLARARAIRIVRHAARPRMPRQAAANSALWAGR